MCTFCINFLTEIIYYIKIPLPYSSFNALLMHTSGNELLSKMNVIFLLNTSEMTETFSLSYTQVQKTFSYEECIMEQIERTYNIVYVPSQLYYGGQNVVKVQVTVQVTCFISMYHQVHNTDCFVFRFLLFPSSYVYSFCWIRNPMLVKLQYTDQYLVCFYCS